jgi:methionyl-tRNA formyltransferase
VPRILLIGQGGTTETALTSLLGCFEVVGVVRQADPDDPVARLALASGVKLYLDTSMTGVERLVAELKPDAVVVSSYDRILRAPLLAQCPFVNVHYAPLPEYRGRATVNWALINGETHAAISIHELVPQLDGGEILYQRLVPITATDTVATLYARLNELQREALGPTVARFLAGEHGRAQDHARATYGCTRLPEDGEIDWSWPTRKIDALVRAVVSPFPGAFTYLRGDRLRVSAGFRGVWWPCRRPTAG